MKEFIFIVGGARSGKSRYAQGLAKKIGRRVAFVATCVPQDREMKKRVARHQDARPRFWKTIEEPRNITSVLAGLTNKFEVVIIDCLGILISNLLSSGLSQRAVEKEIRAIAEFLSKAEFSSIVVSNEVGGGIVPENALARKFRDLAGFSNQIMSKRASDVVLMQCGIPMKIK